MKPEIRYGREDIRYCHYCVYWDANVYTLDHLGRRRLIHRGTGCAFGTENCPFSDEPAEFPPIEPKYETCRDCPYGVGKACIGWCIWRQIKGSLMKTEGR